MRTRDIVKSGIDRNFLRECERQALIKPERIEGEDIIYDNYKPREYSQKDLEVVWNAYLYRKMGLSYEQIKQLIEGEELRVRDSALALIQKYENQIEELNLLIEFLKYVKGVGIIPTPPNSLMGSNSFKEYLTDFIKYLDPERKLKTYLSAVEYMTENDISDIEDEKLEEFISAVREITPNVTDDDRNDLGAAFLKLSELMEMPADSPDVQNIIHDIYAYQKKVSYNKNLSPWDFASQYIFGLSLDSDMKVVMLNIMGEDLIDYFKKALVNFLIIEEPEKIKALRQE